MKYFASRLICLCRCLGLLLLILNVLSAQEVFGITSINPHTEVSKIVNSQNFDYSTQVGAAISSSEEYCQSGGQSNTGLIIKEFKTIGYTQYSNNQCKGYTDYTPGGPIIFKDRQNLSLEIITGNCGVITGGFISIFVDWNQDTDFEDSLEQVILSNPLDATNKFSVTIATPELWKRETYARLRVIVHADKTINACGLFSNGETEDYSLYLEKAFCEEVSNTYPYFESFENETLQWKNLSGDDMDWEVKKPGLAGTSLYPERAAQGDFYMSAEPLGTNLYSEAMLESSCIDLSMYGDQPLLQFSYFMYGDQVRKLILYAVNENGERIFLWDGTLNLGSNWRTKKISLSNFKGQKIKLLFIAEVDRDQKYPIGLDAIQITSPIASDGAITDIFIPKLACDFDSTESIAIELTNSGTDELEEVILSFQLDNGLVYSDTLILDLSPENKYIHTFTKTVDLSDEKIYWLKVWVSGIEGDLHFMNDSLKHFFEHRSISSDFPDFESFEKDFGLWEIRLGEGLAEGIWTRHEGNSPDTQSGPKAAFDSSYYLHTATGNPHHYSDYVLEFSCLDVSKMEYPRLSFAYYLFGRDAGKLEVQIKDEDEWNTVWLRQKDQKESWLTEELVLDEYKKSPFSIRFVGRKNETHYNDISLDAIGIKEFEPCNGGLIYTALNDTLGDGSGDLDYFNSTDCEWLIQPVLADQIILTFEELDLAQGDTIYVYDGIDANGPLLTKLSQTDQTAKPITSLGGSIFIQFVSDDSLTGQGWNAHYKSINNRVAYAYSRSISPYEAKALLGPVAFSLEDPMKIVELTDMKSDDVELISGGTWVDSTWYALDYDYRRMFKIDTITGELTNVYQNMLHPLVGLTYRESDSKFYAVNTSYEDQSSFLFKFDENSEIEIVGITTSVLSGLTEGRDGFFYSIKHNYGPAELAKINPETGKTTIVGSLGINVHSASSHQLATDYNTGHLYAVSGPTLLKGPSRLIRINPETAETTIIGSFPENCLLSAIAINDKISPPYDFTETFQSATLYGIAEIDGEPAASGDWIAAFNEYGDCVGATEVILESEIAYFLLPIYGDDPNTELVEGMKIGESFTIQLYDFSQSAKLNFPVTQTPIYFEGWKNMYGGPLPGFDDINKVYNFLTVSYMDTINLDAGDNWVSIDVAPKDSSLIAVMSTLKPNNLNFVSGFKQQATIYDPSIPSFLNTLKYVERGYGYVINVEEEDTLIVPGEIINDSLKVDLNAGWNYVGYVPRTPEEPSVYYKDLIKSDILGLLMGYSEGTLFFSPKVVPSLNTLKKLENGKGYWLYAVEDVNSDSYRKAFHSQRTPNFMFVNGKLKNVNYLPGEFVDIRDGSGQVRARLPISSEGVLMTTPVYGSISQDALSEGSQDNEKLYFYYQGAALSPAISFQPASGIKSVELRPTNHTLFEVRPNPVNSSTRISYQVPDDREISISLVDMLGRQTILDTRKIIRNEMYSIELDMRDKAVGIYTLQLRIENRVEKSVRLMKLE